MTKITTTILKHFFPGKWVPPLERDRHHTIKIKIIYG